MGWIAKQEQTLEQVKTDAELNYRQQSHFEGEIVEKPKQPATPQPQRPLTFTRPELRHIWQEGDTIEAVALKHGADPEEILDLNLIEEHELQPGDELRIPKKQVVKRSRKIRYEALDHPVDMHVNVPTGIQKYAFGNITDANDVSGTGHFPLGTKITIHGIAHVPVGDSEYLAYYMDGHAFGDFKKNGKISWNIGYAWSELTEGEYVPPAEAIVEAPQPTILDEPDISEPTIFDEMLEEEPEPEVPAEEPKPQDGVLIPLNADYTPEKYMFEQDFTLHELHGRHKPIFRRRLDPVWIIGTFLHEGIEYYQPGKNIGEVVQSGLLWPIPMDSILPEDEVFDFSIKRRGMTRQERWWEFLSKTAARYTKLVEKNKQK